MVVLVFILLVGYKVIGSKIQEGKEKSVLQEKARLEELAKAPLNKCIEDVENQTKEKIKGWQEYAAMLIAPGEKENCISMVGERYDMRKVAAAHNMTLEEYCKGPSLEQIEITSQKMRDDGEKAKDECYKRYK